MNGEQRVKKIKNKFGTTCFVRWGLKGGNPVLLAQGKKNRSKK